MVVDKNMRGITARVDFRQAEVGNVVIPLETVAITHKV